MKKYIAGFVAGALVSTGIALAVEYQIEPNPYPVVINGREHNIEGYNINGRSYFQLRDLGKAMDFAVGFQNEQVVVDGSKPNSEVLDSTPTPTATPNPNAMTKEELVKAVNEIDVTQWMDTNTYSNANVTASDGVRVYIVNDVLSVGRYDILAKYNLEKKCQFMSSGDLTMRLETYTGSFVYDGEPLIEVVPKRYKTGYIPLDYYEKVLLPFLKAYFELG